MNNGFIYLWRKIMDSSFYKNPNCCHLAVHLLLKVNHSTNKFIFNSEELVVEKGSTITGRKKLVEETGLSERNIRTCLKLLEKIGFLTIKTTNQFSIISISKYNEYQKQTTNKVTSHRPATDQPPTTNNNENNDNKELLLKIPNRLDLSKGQLITFAREFNGLTTTEIKEQQSKCNAYMNMSSQNYTNPGLYFKGWLKRYTTEKRIKESQLSVSQVIEASLPKISEEERQRNLIKIAEIRSNLSSRIRGMK